MLDALFVAELLGRIVAFQFMRMISAVAVVRILSEMMTITTEMGGRMHRGVVEALAQVRCELRWIGSMV